MLLGHPAERLRAGPVAAQPHLQEPVAAQRAGLDQPAHRLAVAVERAELDVAGVGVRVEVDHRDLAEAEVPGDAGRVRQRDRVVAAEHQRDRRRRDATAYTASSSAAERRARSRRAASRRRRRRRRGGPGARRRAAPGAAASRRAAGSRSAGSPSARTGCPAGATCRRRTARRRSPRRPRRARRRRRGRPRSTPRKVMSGPNWAPYRVMGQFLPAVAARRRPTRSGRADHGLDRNGFRRSTPRLRHGITCHRARARADTMDDHGTRPRPACSRPPRPPVDALHPALGPTSTPTCPIIVRGEGAYIYDAKGKRYLDGLAGLFVSQLGHGRTELAEAAAKQAEELAFMPLWSYAHPNAIELAERVAGYAPGDLNRVFFTSGGGEAVETAWKLAKNYFKLTGKPMKHKVISRAIAYHGTTAGRAVDHRPAGAEGSSSSRSCPRRSGCPNTNFYRAPEHVQPATTSRPSAAGPPTRSRSRSRTRAPTPSPRSSSSRCRTPAAASRRRPATSSGSARSATSTTCCWSPTRSSAPSAGSATCSAPSATATSPTSSPAPRASPRATPRSAR